MTRLHRSITAEAVVRRMRRLALVAALAACVTLLGTVSASAEPPRARRVVIVLASDVDWSRVGPKATPTLDLILNQGTVGNVVVRRQLGETTRIAVPAEAALTLSAGTWTLPALGAKPAYDATEVVDGQPAATSYESLYGRPSGAAQVVYLGRQFAQSAQDKASLGAQLGSLARSFEASGSGIACVGNSDWGRVGARNLERPAGVAAADTRAVVAAGTVGASLLMSDPAAPYGLRTDIDRFRSAFESASASASERGQVTLVVLDAGDTFRVSRAERGAQRKRDDWSQLAIDDLEHTISLGVSGLAPNDLLMVISIPTDGSAKVAQGFGRVVLWGRKFSPKPGLATSTSTRREGLVTLPDLSATAVAAAGMPLPVGFIGTPVDSAPESGSVAERFGALKRLDNTARAVQQVKYLVVAYFAAAVLLLVGAVLGEALFRGPGKTLPPALAWTLEGLLLLVASVPLASWLAFAFDRFPQTAGRVFGGLALVTLGVWALSMVLRLVTSARVSLAALLLATAAMLAVDQWLGAPLSFATLLGYTPLEAARFYGIGNEGAAMMISAGLIGVALVSDHLGYDRGRRFASWAVPVAGAVLVATAVLPEAGANIGVAIWGTFAVVVASRLASGHRLNWKVVALALAVAALVVLGAAWIDSLSSSQTHVAKAISSAESHGAGVLGTILLRKASASAAYLQATPAILVFVALYVWLLVGSFRRTGLFERVGVSDPRFSGVMQAILAAGLVAYLSEDSGIVMPVTLTTFTLIAFAYLVVLGRRRSIEAPGADGTEAAA